MRVLFILVPDLLLAYSSAHLSHNITDLKLIS